MTHRDNIPLYQQAWANPRTIAPDRLAQSGRAATFEGVVGARMMTEGARRLIQTGSPSSVNAVVLIREVNQR